MRCRLNEREPERTSRQHLRALVGSESATLRDDQWTAIHALVAERRRALVVQRTGWGKSAVYFVATALLREQGAGPTVIISPLLALMRNQIAAAGAGRHPRGDDQLGERRTVGPGLRAGAGRRGRRAAGVAGAAEQSRASATRCCRRWRPRPAWW